MHLDIIFKAIIVKHDIRTVNLRDHGHIIYVSQVLLFPMKLIRKGKVKDVYDLADGRILFHFSDRISAFDVKMNTLIPRKGEVLCKFADYWFNILGTRHHMLALEDKDKIIAKNTDIIPLECVVRGYFYGSLLERHRNGQLRTCTLPDDFRPIMAAKLIEPIFDPTTKSEEHDIPVSENEAISTDILSRQEFDYLKETSISLYNKMNSIAERAGFIIADVKFEFGRDRNNGDILLADSLGPDEYRLWRSSDYQPGKVQESYDKQLLRDWLIKIGFKDKIDELRQKGQKPDPPDIPAELVSELTRRYVFAYERITGRKL
jgi:phosphoribosylaminoimidazole-succinocarboxamide synthase